MALTPEQRRTARIFAKQLQKAGATPRVAKALYLAGLQESGLRNLNYGDRDSLGTLQERTSIYGRTHALDPAKSAQRFIRDAMQVNQGFKGSAGALAQAVQRSAFPDAYDTHSAEGDRLVRQYVGGGSTGSRGSGGSSGTTVPTRQTGQSAPLDVGDPSALTALLQSQLSQPARPGSTSAPTPPSFAAGPTLARDAIQTTAPQPKKPDLSATLSAVQSLTGTDLPASQTAAQTGAKGPSASGGAKRGPKGVVKFDGKPVRSDFAKELAWARAHGWNGTVISGFRTKAEQMAAAKRYGLQHYGPNGPLGSNHVVGHRGAVDVTDPEQLNKILGRYPGKRSLIWGGPVIGDRPHFSPTGH